jgi:hypothetical protein
LSRSDEQRLTDIIEAAREVLGLVSHGKDAWDTDRVKQLAVERPWRSSARPLGR